MGEHWIRVGLLFDSRFDPSRPEVLNYVVVDGTPMLVGVGYAVPLLRGEHPPGSPAGASAWHDHARTIEDETVLPHHDASGDANDGSRLAMLHAWIWAPNPGGLFAADNWAIPFLRLGLAAPGKAVPAAGKALALAGGGRDYFEMAIEAAGALTAEERARVTRALSRAQHAVQAILTRQAGPVLSEAEQHDLVAVWRVFWTDVDAALTDAARQKLAHLPIR